MVRFMDGSKEVFPPGRLAEFKEGRLLVGYQNEIEAEYRLRVVKGWRYLKGAQQEDLPIPAAQSPNP